MSPELYVLTIALLPLTAIIVFAMKYAASYAAARARLAEQDEVRAMLTAQADHLARIATTLRAMEANLSRQAAVVLDTHAILKQVG